LEATIDMQASATQRLTPGCLRAALACLALCVCTLAMGADVQPAAPARLAAKYEEVRSKLAHNEFQRPLTLESQETSRSLRGDIYTTVDYAFGLVQTELTNPQHWCDVMILHQNTKYCRVNGSGADTSLAVQVGRKYDEPVDAAKAMHFAYTDRSDPPEYFRVALEAESGMFGTRNYHIVLEGIPLGSGKTFLHLSYSYEFGLAAKLALQTYLNTLGSGKIGFTVVEKRSDGEPVYVGDVRGALERNVMRMYLAIEAYLDAVGSPPAQRADKRIRDWFAATERYAPQLHELDAKEYVEMKTREYRRMQADAGAAAEVAK
jgi:hypothetical protein